jgi:hypothetical protein
MMGTFFLDEYNCAGELELKVCFYNKRLVLRDRSLDGEVLPKDDQHPVCCRSTVVYQLAWSHSVLHLSLLSHCR